MRTRSILYLLLFSALLGGCTSYLPSGRVPLPPMAQETVKVVTIPLPVIASSPNEGITYGGLGAFLLHNGKDQISTLIAAQLNQNDNFGTSASLYGAFYPSPDRSFEGNLSKSTSVNEDYEGSARFFGFQSSSKREMESNYADEETGFSLSAGYPVLKDTQLVLGERLKDVEIGRGAVRKVPFLREVHRFANIPGSDGFTAHAQMLSLVYSTLDSQTLPTAGVKARISAETSVRALGSSADYRHYEAEAKGFYPLDDARFISVGRLSYSQTIGDDVPFLERSTLGGETTLRGYGKYRFIDSSYLLLNLEERISLFRWEVFGVRADWELAPFVDLGGVMKILSEASARSFEFNPGVGFRAVIRPNIVGRIDVGIGREGPAVFVGLGYPF